MKIDTETAAQLERDERAIRIAEAIASLLGRKVEVLDADGTKFWVAEPAPNLDS
jgi:hypothetical protein